MTRILLFCLLASQTACASPFGLPPEDTGDGYRKNWPVPYLCQRDYEHIGGPACGPTSVAMLLRFYYPNARIDMPDVWHSGTQQHRFRGPAAVYRNILYLDRRSERHTQRLSKRVPGFEKYYDGKYSGTAIGNLRSYLQNIWGFRLQKLTSKEKVFEAIREGPLLGSVRSQKGDLDSTRSSGGHYIVIRGVDVSRDLLYINDPGRFKKFPSNNRPVDCERFFKNWFRCAFQLLPAESEKQRRYSVLVDTCHNAISGNSAAHVFALDDPYARTASNQPVWRFVYNGYPPVNRKWVAGDWYYSVVGGRSASWKPYLAIPGKYRVVAKFRGNPKGGSVCYAIYSSSGRRQARKKVRHTRKQLEWCSVVIGPRVFLSRGCRVRAENIPPDTNVDAIKFTYLGR